MNEAEARARCEWCGDDPLYVRYHDEEWGRPSTDEARLFEKLCLEGFQAGLSWLTILRKREAFRAAFRGFDVNTVARFDGADVARLLGDAGIVRHRGKIESAINNARRVQDLRREHGSFAAFLWRFAPPAGVAAVPERLSDLPTRTPESEALAKALKKAGFSFVGPTTVYAFMQSMGMVNDHVAACHVRADVARLQRELRRP